MPGPYPGPGLSGGWLLRVLLRFQERLRRLADLAVARQPAAVDELRELLEQELLDRGIAAVLPDGVELERIQGEVVHLPTAVRVFGQQIAPGSNCPVSRRDDGTRELRRVVE